MERRRPTLAAKLRKLGESLYVDTRLPPRMRTIAILRICGLLGCEWGGQAEFWGPITGVSDGECDVLAVGDADDPRWTESERALIRAVDEQRMELLVAVGWYRTICTLCNGLALPTEGWMRRWPASAD